MPGFDGTGPRGMGPMTGGGRGFCSPWGIGAAPGGYGIPQGVGYGYPRYSGAGVPYPFYGAPASVPGQAPYPSYGGIPYGGAPIGPMPGAMPFAPQVTPEQELDFLRNQAQTMKGQLEQIESRMHELETKGKQV